MTAQARLLCIIGSGEMAPAMASLHAELMTRAGSPPAPAIMIDSSYGFQENADEISRRAETYFRVKVRHPLSIVSLRDRDASDALMLERAYSQVRDARFIFAGPGSPTYALRQWRDTLIPSLLAERLRDGGCITFASAAAIALGKLALPVYEIYKVGERPHWVAGLDLLAPLGLNLVVIPHYDNREGGSHDTRYCYMGERRLQELERQLPAGLGILGIAEHTAAIFDLGAGTLQIRGRGFVALRNHGQERRLTPGPRIPFAGLETRSTNDRASTNVEGKSEEPNQPLLHAMQQRCRQFERALDGGDIDGAVSSMLEADDQLAGYAAADANERHEFEQARSAFRSMVVRLGEAAHVSGSTPDRLAPFVELALRLRDEARRERRYPEADLVRNALLDLGIEVRDTPVGPRWSPSEERPQTH
jgi:cyanophycinase-like exopeptidase